MNLSVIACQYAPFLAFCTAGLLTQLAPPPRPHLQCNQCAATGGLAPAVMAQPVASGQQTCEIVVIASGSALLAFASWQ